MTGKMQCEDLRELLDEHIKEHGEFRAEELAEAHDALYGAADEADVINATIE